MKGRKFADAGEVICMADDQGQQLFYNGMQAIAPSCKRLC